MRSCFVLVLTILFTAYANGTVRDAAINEQESNVISDVEPQLVSVENMHWATGDSIDVSIGPENAVYCVIQAPNGHILFDNFGQCKIALDRVTVSHRGAWIMRIATAGTVTLQTHTFYVDVHARGGAPLVTTDVQKERPTVTMACSVPSPHTIHSCKFRDHRGNILVADQTGASTASHVTSVSSQSCSLHLRSPVEADLGIWRCAVETSTGTYYGFLTVVCPFLMTFPEIAANVITEPVLEDRTVSSFVEGDSVTFNCAANTALRYCYFRARNGSTFSVSPGMASQENFEYVGAGLDAGECGIKFNRFSASEAGRWTCHVGLVNSTVPELSTEIIATVAPRMTARHFYNDDNKLVVEMQVHNESPIDYCRFVRMNGQGFSSENVPSGFSVNAALNRGRCTLYMEEANVLNLHPWTVAAKITDEDGEISMDTMETLMIFPPSPPLVGEESSNSLYWLLVIPLVLIPLIIALTCMIKRKKGWVYRKSSWVSRSFRSTDIIVKKPPTDHHHHHQGEERDQQVNGGMRV